MPPTITSAAGFETRQKLIVDPAAQDRPLRRVPSCDQQRAELDFENRDRGQENACRRGSYKFQHIGHRQAWLLRPVSRTLRPHGQQHDRHFVLGQSKLAVHCFGIETDHRCRTQA